MKYLVALLFCGAIGTSIAQNAYYDAFKLLELKHLKGDTIKFRGGTEQEKLLLEICQKYSDASDYKGLAHDFKGNPFIYLPPNEGSSVNAAALESGQSLISNIAGLDVTTIVQGLSQFMIERSKQELTIAFFNRFKNFVNENSEIQVLFPKTTDNLNNLLGYNYPEMLPVLRTSFHEDLNSIPYNLDDILELPRYRVLLEELPEVRVAIKSIRLVHELQLGEKHPADIINAFATLEEWSDPNASDELKNMGNAIALGSIFSQSLRYSHYSMTEESSFRSVDTTKVLFYGEINLGNNKSAKIYPTTVEEVTIYLKDDQIKYYKPESQLEVSDLEELPSNQSPDDYDKKVLKLESKKYTAKAEITRNKTITIDWNVENELTFEVTEIVITSEIIWSLHVDKPVSINEVKRTDSINKKQLHPKEIRAWVKLEQIEKMTQDKVLMKIFLGLLYQNVNKFNQSGVQFSANGRTTKFAQIIQKNRDNLFLFQNQLTEFIELGERVEKAKNDIIAIRSTNDKPSNDQLFEYINTSIDVIEYSFGLASLLDGNIEVDDYVNLARKGNELFKHIYQKEYASAINDGVDILETTIGIIEKKSFKEIPDSVIEASLEGLSGVKTKKKNKVLNSIKKDNFEKIKTTKCAQKSIDKVWDEIENSSLNPTQKEELRSAIAHVRLAQLKEILPDIAKYGTFMANMVKAESPEEVKAILENVVLPVGSSSIKKNAKFNVAVQSYLGAYWAPSGLGSNPTDETMSWNQPFGVTAPIGFSFSIGLREKRGSLSAFVSILDIGAIVDYDLQTDSISTSSSTTTVETSKEYKIELGQIFSPGFYIVYGAFNNIPLSLSGGFQYGPGIFDISSTEGSLVNENPYWRLSLTLTVDIPLFNLHHKPKKFRTFKN